MPSEEMRKGICIQLPYEESEKILNSVKHVFTAWNWITPSKSFEFLCLLIHLITICIFFKDFILFLARESSHEHEQVEEQSGRERDGERI